MRIWTEDCIKKFLDRDDEAVVRAIIAIQALQTADEQMSGQTKETNGVGWNKFDAEWMGQMIAGYHKWGRLTPKQMAVTRNKVKRYWRQLVKLANDNQARKMGVAAEETILTASIESVDDEFDDPAYNQQLYADQAEAVDAAKAEAVDMEVLHELRQAGYAP